MSMTAYERFPLAPLLDAVYERLPAEQWPGSRGNAARHGKRATDAEVAACLGIHRQTICKWRAGGGVPIWAADSAAVRLGLHPALIWPDFLAEAC